ncbi:MAG: molybdopterin-guanine dinucleotide biosynthesis protein B [Methanosarcinales archaeon]|nr:molybdopterin-guanine dinucleotide biosynthesis protein B [Methanosarcinales archaeon]
MKAISVVGPHKSGKTTLVTALVRALAEHGRVGTIKHMPGHPMDQGDTGRHFQVGASVVMGLGQACMRLCREWTLESALQDLEESGMDYAIVEGFKNSALPKIVLGGIKVTNAVRELNVSQLDEDTVKELAEMVMQMEDY